MDVKLKIFISSVQSEFAHERKALAAYIREDVMLGEFFEAGSGTGVVVDKCVEQGLTRPDFDPTVGFFKTLIWREGTQSASSRGTQSEMTIFERIIVACHLKNQLVNFLK